MHDYDGAFTTPSFLISLYLDPLSSYLDHELIFIAFFYQIIFHSFQPINLSPGFVSFLPKILIILLISSLSIIFYVLSCQQFSFLFFKIRHVIFPQNLSFQFLVLFLSFVFYSQIIGCHIFISYQKNY